MNETQVDGMVRVDSDFGRRIGFTSDKFHGYLWLVGDRVYISIISSVTPGRGDLMQLFANIEAAGYRVAVPTPMPHMQAILEAKGFVAHIEPSEGEDVEVWEKPDALPS